MLKRNRGDAISHFFVSAKTCMAIPARHPSLRDALIQASLDPTVTSIDYIGSTVVSGQEVDLAAIVLNRGGQSFILDVIPSRPLRDLEHEGLALIAIDALKLEPWVITAEELRREPRYTNSKLVWSYHRRQVPIELRMNILQSLLEEQPMQLGQLLQRIRSDRYACPAIMTLACENLIELDLDSRPLGPTTIVKSCG